MELLQDSLARRVREIRIEHFGGIVVPVLGDILHLLPLTWTNYESGCTIPAPGSSTTSSPSPMPILTG